MIVAKPEMFILSKCVWPSTSRSTKSPLPTNVVAVTTPDIETLSKFVWPSTSKSPFRSMPVAVTLVAVKIPIL